MREATRMYKEHEIPLFVAKVTGDLMQAWESDDPLICANSHCQQTIQPGSYFTLHTLHWFTGGVWKKRKNQPFCIDCIPFYLPEAQGEGRDA